MFEFRLPDVGEGVAEGELVQWLVAAGDTVEEDQPVAEVETDKALVEIPSPVDGTVAELRAEEGETIPVGEVFVVFEEAGDEGSEAEVETEAESGPEQAPEPEPEPAGGDGDDGRVFAPPRVRRLARELDVDLAAVEGSGPGGRVTEADVRAVAEGGDEAGSGVEAQTESEPEAEAEPEPRPAPDREPASRDRTLAAPATRRLADELGVDIDRVPAVEERDGEAFVTPEAVRSFAEAAPATTDETAPVPVEGREERVPYRGLRRTIGEQMERSAYTAPHVTHHDVADAAALVAAREELREPAEERGVRLTYLPFVMKAVVAALSEHPQLNAELDEEAEEIVRKNYYNLGFATATDDGLLVPVVEDVDESGLFELASEVNELAERARERTIAREEMRGGTFTITNFGAVGGEYGTPIINYPEAAILGLGAIEERPHVVEGEVVARETLPLSLSFDHRVTDGAVAARFTNRVIEYIENPLKLLI